MKWKWVFFKKFLFKAKIILIRVSKDYNEHLEG